jgi:hypothetical protein
MGAQPGVGNLGQVLAQNPQMLAQFLQQMGQSNPELVQQLLANPQALQQLIQSVGGDMGDEGEEGEDGLPDDFGGMEEHVGQQQLVQLTPAEEASVRRITELGFPFQRAVEVRGDERCADCVTHRALNIFAGISSVRPQRGTGRELPFRTPGLIAWGFL